MVTKGPAGNSKPFITGCLAGGFRDQVWRVAGRAHLTALDILTIPILHRFPAGVVGNIMMNIPQQDLATLATLV